MEDYDRDQVFHRPPPAPEDEDQDGDEVRSISDLDSDIKELKDISPRENTIGQHLLSWLIKTKH